MADVADTSGSSVASAQTGSPADLQENNSTSSSPEAVPPEVVPPVAVQKGSIISPPVAGAFPAEKTEHPPSEISTTQVAAGVSSSAAVSSSTEVSSDAAASTGAGGSSASRPGQDGAKKPLTKRTPNDFIFGKVIGEGSYSTVMVAAIAVSSVCL